jgi:hypothetical protein
LLGLRHLAAAIAVAGLASILPSAQMPRAHAGELTTILDNGPPDNRVDIAIVGDGYTSGEMEKYHGDVAHLVDGFFAQEPFREYRSYFNVTRVDVVSSQSGADHPERGRSVTTAFDATYNCESIQRMICVDRMKVWAELSARLEPTQYDVTVVLVNDAEYGGAGGALNIASAHPDVVELVLHETGHGFGLLVDEYGGGNQSGCGQFEPRQANATAATSRSAIKWNHWIDATTPVPTTSIVSGRPGLYQGAAFCDAGVYRPTPDSKMRSLGRPYEQVNTEQLIKRLYSFVSPIDSASPQGSSVAGESAGPFTVTPLSPASHTLDVEWLLDGVVVGTSDQMPSATLSAGRHAVRVTVTDRTPAVRSDPEQVLSESQDWSVEVGTETGIGTGTGTGTGTGIGTGIGTDPGALAFAPVDDAHVSAARPTLNFGKSRSLNVKGGKRPIDALMRFEITGIVGPVTGATLKMNVSEASDTGGELHALRNASWSERKVTQKRAPAISAETISSVDFASTGDVVEFELTGVVTGNGTYSFAIVSDSPDRVSYASKESPDGGPMLLLTQ